MNEEQSEEKRLWTKAQKILLHQKIHALLLQWDQQRKNEATLAEIAKQAEMDNTSLASEQNQSNSTARDASMRSATISKIEPVDK